MGAIFFDSEVVANQKLNYKFHLIKLRLKNSKEKFNFTPGQFVVIKMGPSLYRSYSVASNPDKLPYWQLFIDITPGGPGSTFLKNLKPGQIIQHSLGKGTFVLKQRPAPYNIMAATGCGLASIIPMVENLLQQTNKKVLFLWGLRYQKDLCFLDWLDSLTHDVNFNYQIVLSKPSASWKGAKGHLITLLLKLVSSMPKNKQNIYLCGNQLMINDVKLILQTINFAEDKIYFERYY